MEDLIKELEGFRSKPYKDTEGILTIGYGTTFYPNGIKVKETDEAITEKQAEAYLNDYIFRYVAPAFKHIHIKLTKRQESAVASLVYNVGLPAFLNSELIKHINNKRWAGVFKEWDFGIRQRKGLIKRRAKELALFIADI